jgi:two-component system, OmpR family, sensor histidine kinase BaeS
VIPADDPQRLAVLVHELRSPVAALSAIAQAFSDDRLESPARLELSRLAITACLGIQRVVIDAAVASVQLVPVDIVALVHELVATAKLAGAPVRSELAPDLPRITADPLRLRQALDNLVANALTHAGSAAEAVLSATSDGTLLFLAVSDSGAGVPITEQERIFEAGVRLDFGSTGSGLGLAIARAIARAHGGELTLRSTPGEGATFTLALPVG